MVRFFFFVGWWRTWCGALVPWYYLCTLVLQPQQHSDIILFWLAYFLFRSLLYNSESILTYVSFTCCCFPFRYGPGILSLRRDVQLVSLNMFIHMLSMFYQNILSYHRSLYFSVVDKIIIIFFEKLNYSTAFFPVFIWQSQY